ncbi:bifunctional metallophosphatase/5'-nucleotidase [Leucobacter sp. HY1908]
MDGVHDLALARASFPMRRGQGRPRTKKVYGALLAAALVTLVCVAGSPVDGLIAATPAAAAPLETPAPPTGGAYPAGAATVQLLAINDFHGRIEAAPAANDRGPAGAAVLAGAVTQLTADNPNTVLVAAGDNIGASTFTSAIAQDEPTIDALLAAGLAASAVGNHEFDRGFADLRDRVMPRYGDPALTLGANVYDRATGVPVLGEYTIIERGGIKIGLIGTVTEHTAIAVNPALIAGLEFRSQLDTVNRVAADIDDLVDATVLLTHDGFASENCVVNATEASTFGDLAREASPLVDAIVSGHSHLQYNCTVAGRPVIQTGNYGSALGQIELRFDVTGVTPVFTGATSDLLPLSAGGVPSYGADPTVSAIVDSAIATAEVLGNRPVGRIAGDIVRGGTPPGSDRSVESALGNLLADITLASLPGADLGVVNPGSMREDLIFDAATLPHPGTVTYRDVANVQPFANMMASVKLTGAQLKQMLEQQWSNDQNGTEVKRHLGISDALRYTYISDAPAGSRITSMKLNGVDVAPAVTYTVVTNAFLAAGGDGFTVFGEGAELTELAFTDTQITLDYFAARDVVASPGLGRSQVGTAPGDEEDGVADGDDDGREETDQGKTPPPASQSDGTNGATSTPAPALARTGSSAGAGHAVIAWGGFALVAAAMCMLAEVLRSRRRS